MASAARKRLLVVGVLGFLAIFSVAMLFPILPQEASELLSYLGRTATAFVAATAMAYRARSATGSLRRARGILAALLFAAACGGIVSSISLVTRGEGVAIPSLADAFYLGLVPIVIYALLSYPTASELSGSKLRALLDGLIAAVSIGAMFYLFVISSLVMNDQFPLPTQLTLLAYPAACILIVGIAVSMMLRVSGSARRELAITCLGLAILSFEEIAFVVLKSSGTYQPNSWVAVVAEIGLVLIVAGAMSSSTDVPRTALGNKIAPVARSGLLERYFDAEPAEGETSGSWLRLTPLLPSFMVALVIVSSLIAVAIGHEFSLIELSFYFLLLGLLAIQQFVSNRDRDVLSTRLKSRGELFQSLVTGSSDLITLHDRSTGIRYASPAVLRALGMSREELSTLDVLAQIHPDDQDNLLAEVNLLMARPGGVVEIVLRMKTLTVPGVRPTQTGTDDPPVGTEWRWMQVLAHNMISDESVRGIVCNTRDIHDQQVLRQRLSFDAYHDALTGLGNLALARQLLGEHCYGKDGRPASVLMTDLDDFKSFNDTFGHAFGDELLVAVARRLRTCVTNEDAVVRIGGDEFVLVFDSEHSADQVASEILAQLRRPFLVNGTSISVEASIGIARSVDAASPEEVLRNADLAMYSAKAHGGSTSRWYDPVMFATAASRLQIQEGIKRALDMSLFKVDYQPIVTLPDGHTVGAEALIRWNDPELGDVSPEDFIPIAEGTGIIAQIDRWVIGEVCAQISKWQAAGVSAPQISVNVSRRQLSGGLVEVVERALRTHAIEPTALCIEVTESAVIFDTDEATATLERLRELGVAIALDDFGTGQSSLSQLARLPIDKVKIDKSFVQNSSSDRSALRFLRSIVGVCRTLDLPIIAEGIEDDQAAQNLASMGAQYGQGYFFSRPLPESDFTDLISGSIPAQRAQDDLPVEDDVANKLVKNGDARKGRRPHLRAM
ncbi:MAG: EAL domain-containing protein [Actinobacteria bacterium]|nr:EAL domain-containing protein [Actinomycetota bacterium]